MCNSAAAGRSGSTRKAPRWDGVRRFTGDHPRKERPNFGLCYARQVCDTRAAGRLGRKRATMSGRAGNRRRMPRSGESRRPGAVLPICHGPLQRAVADDHRPIGQPGGDKLLRQLVGGAMSRLRGIGAAFRPSLGRPIAGVRDKRARRADTIPRRKLSSTSVSPRRARSAVSLDISPGGIGSTPRMSQSVRQTRSGPFQRRSRATTPRSFIR
jgi:hypothetical protein